MAEELELFAGETVETPDRVIVLTNQANLRSILSAGYCGPIQTYGRYKRDLLSTCPGRIPLLAAPAWAEVAAEVVAEEDWLFPVALEFDVEALRLASVPSTGSTVGSEHVTPMVWAPGGILPLSALRFIYFRCETDLDEYASREVYEGLQDYSDLFAVNQEIFAAPSPTSNPMARLGELDAIDCPKRGDFVLQERANGALTLLLRACPEDEDVLAAAARLCEGRRQEKTSRLPSWLRVDAIFLDEPSGKGGTDQKLFEAILHVLRRTDPTTEWRAKEVVAAIEKQLDSLTFAKKDVEPVAKHLRAIREILDNKKDRSPFSDASLTPLKALLLVLLRPDPKRFFGWTASELGADLRVWLTAAFFCGVLRPLRKIPVEFRTRGLDSYCAALLADRLKEVWTDPAYTPAKGTLRVSVEREGATLLLVSPHGVLRTYERSLVDAMAGLDLESTEVSSAVADWCSSVGWTDCVRTVVELAEARFDVVPYGKLGVSIQIPGSATIRRELDRVGFRKRTAGLEPGAIQDEQLQRLLACSEKSAHK